MNVEYKRLDLKSIDLTDLSFVTSYGFSLTLLKESIKKVGVLNPPLVKDKSNKYYQVVCGFKRLLACQDMGKEELICSVIKQNIKDRDAFLISLYDNLSHRNLNSIEKSIVINKLLDYYPDEIIVKDFLPLLGLGPHYSVLNRYKPLKNMEKEIKDAIVAEKIDKRVAIKLFNFSKQDRALLFKFISNLKLSKNKQNEVIENIHDIVKRDECPVSSILYSKELKDSLENSNLSVPQRGTIVRRFLRKLRYPKIVNAEKNFSEIKKNLKLGNNIKLTPPPHFEGSKYNVDFQFETLDELNDKLKKISTIKNDKEFKKIIED